MIIIRYLVRETLKSQPAMLFILLLASFCQELVRIPGAAVDDNIPANLVLSLLGLGVPEMVQLILSLSLFLELLMTPGKLYVESEATIIYARGLNRVALVKAAVILAVFTVVVTAASVVRAGPWSSHHRDEMLAEAKANPGMTVLTQGQFQQATNGSSALLIESVDGSDFKDVFLAQIRPRGNARPSVAVADSGYLTQLRDGSQVVIFNQGAHFEGAALLRDFRITDLQDYQAITGHQAVAPDPNDIDQMDMCILWNIDTDRAHAELSWRVTLVFTMFIIALMVVLLSVVNPRQRRVLSVLPAMLLYLLFFLIQTSLKSNGGKGKLNPTLWIWTASLIYLALVTVLSLWDTMPIRRLHTNFSRKGAV